MHPGSRLRWRLDLSPSPPKSRGRARKGAASARPPEVAAFEKEFPGASWLSAQVFRNLEEVGSQAEALIASVARRHGLSHAALNALAVIEGNGAPMTAGAVGAHMHITSGTMTSVLDTLERYGYIKRLTDPDDRRRVLVDVTPEAQAVLNRLLPEVVQTTTVVMTGIDDTELYEFLGTLARVRAAIAAAPDELPHPAPRRTPRDLTRS
jgi:MarR family transcriptional regulator, 2-MHQ and catechol-resistance regulon repressor